MTDPPGIEPFAARKETLLRQVLDAVPDAQAIFAADKLSKLTTLRSAVERDGERTVRRRMGPLLHDQLERYDAALV